MILKISSIADGAISQWSTTVKSLKIRFWSITLYFLCLPLFLFSALSHGFPPSLPFTARTHSCQLFSLLSFRYHTSLYLANFPPPCIPYSLSLNSNPYQDLCFAFLVCYETLFLLISKIPVMTENVYSVSEYFLNFCVSSICQFVYFLCDCTFCH